MRWTPRERALKRSAAKKQLNVTKSPIDGTFMIDLISYVPLFPERIKTKPWGRGSKIHPPEAAIYGGATLREAERFIWGFIPPWSRRCDPEVAASISKALIALGDAARNSRRRAGARRCWTYPNCRRMRWRRCSGHGIAAGRCTDRRGSEPLARRMPKMTARPPSSGFPRRRT